MRSSRAARLVSSRLASRAASGWLSATIEAPTLTFDRALHVHLGNRDVDVRFLGRGNTLATLSSLTRDLGPAVHYHLGPDSSLRSERSRQFGGVTWFRLRLGHRYEPNTL